ncbi:hypothetical protein JTE90_024132 [Oedothorax gibbosus]|uniref:Uncharacterized protein n=1 Tax=Oedothorax gibbosus TaxID=931172 RepID=A0AAV6U5W8_9ARAC|nr:hypothetical protein JTE90_024132 [Oedothorax gibbosus]
MGLLIRASFLLVVLCSTLEFSSAQASLGGFVPVGTYSRRSSNGDNEFISSVGNAKVAVYRKEHRQPRPLAVVPLPVPVARPVPRYPPLVESEKARLSMQAFAGKKEEISGLQL